MSTQQPCILALIGPTASGKTDLAIRLASRFPLSLISVDSACIYRRMDIGTSKPSRAVRAQYPHALVDILEPEESFTASEFVDLADAEIRKTLQQGKTPLLVGGTMLYFKAFREGLTSLPSRDEEFRKKLRQEKERLGSPVLHARLREIDPVTSERIHPNNYSRIERALEVHAISGQSLSHWIENQPSQPVQVRHKSRYVEFGLEQLERATLHARIKTRLDEMIENGFVDEVQELQKRPNLNVECTSMKAVGYAQLWRSLKEQPETPYNSEIREEILAATRQLARRQLTWMRSWGNVESYISIGDQTVSEFLEQKFCELGL
ncbi:MAG: tRNA (adenosine(37)-N6)-dimethylallyltransferase MiaA [Gammaproteobacteria bacterium]|nr:tRNA (adenosine(37)-N6)-dimethylallyltransferase MiaA [Gammaproteobacteria bacterium]